MTEAQGVPTYDTDERSTCHYLGFKYARSWTSSNGCRGALEFTIAAMEWPPTRLHSCRNNVVAGTIVDVTADMRSAADRLAIASVARPARQIWEELRSLYYADDNPSVVRGLSETQVVSRIYRARRLHYSGNVHGAIEIPPLSLVLNEPVSFFQFHSVTANSQDVSSPNRLIGWAHPALLNLLRYNNTTLFVDGTFRCVPRGFVQCVILMVHDRASGIFVPAFYVLSTYRTSDSYWDIIHHVVQATDQRLSPAEVICDFEAGLMDAVQTQFPDAMVVGCLFH
ncbi:Hypothetical protein PHPALM_7596 [Phytophthora palmivora]|uniref:MULE transposase domain-containing protein n=1 Tax=Phytophthora palmivora TaxID=4796 RepID=A0A2P4YBX7_9STRA|nr:Hypothetical protein PHPALM_7596 [Phytophthora palmivora]